MTKDEIIQYNKNVHSFLDYKETSSDQDFYFVEHPETKDLRELNFNRKYVEDWNYIMEVVEAIEKLEGWIQIDGLSDRTGCTIRFGDTWKVIAQKYNTTKKDAVVEAINQFLIWYKTQTINS